MKVEGTFVGFLIQCLPWIIITWWVYWAHWTPLTEFLKQQVCGRVKKFAFSTDVQGTLLLVHLGTLKTVILFQRLHFRKCHRRPRETEGSHLHYRSSEGRFRPQLAPSAVHFLLLRSSASWVGSEHQFKRNLSSGGGWGWCAGQLWSTQHGQRGLAGCSPWGSQERRAWLSSN